MKPRRPSPPTVPAFVLALAWAVVAAWAAPAAFAQETEAAGAVPPADPADVASVDAIIEAVYDVISGPAGEARDWDRFRSLFVPEARLIPVYRPRDGEGWAWAAASPQGYIERSGPYLVENGFFETEIHRVEERYGPLVHLFSTYESRNRADDPEPFARGINSFQLVWDGGRWWVVSIFWMAESEEHPIPERYLPGG